MEVISEILLEDAEISSIELFNSISSRLLLLTSDCTWLMKLLASLALSTLCFTVADNSFILAAVCSSDDACDSVRAERSSLLNAISLEAVSTSWLAFFTLDNTSRILATSVLTLSAVAPSSSFLVRLTRCVKSRLSPIFFIVVCKPLNPFLR